MKAIKIDVEKKQVYEVDYSGDFHDIYTLIGNGCRMFTCPVSYENNDGLFCDDEILLHPVNIKGAFIYPEWEVPLINNAVIIGCDDEGDAIEVKSTVEEIAKDIKWISLDELINFAVHG